MSATPLIAAEEPTSQDFRVVPLPAFSIEN